MYCIVAMFVKKHVGLQPGKSQCPCESPNTFAVEVLAGQGLQAQETGFKVLTTMALASHLTVLTANSPPGPFLHTRTFYIYISPGMEMPSCTRESEST